MNLKVQVWEYLECLSSVLSEERIAVIIPQIWHRWESKENQCPVHPYSVYSCEAYNGDFSAEYVREVMIQPFVISVAAFWGYCTELHHKLAVALFVVSLSIKDVCHLVHVYFVLKM